MTQELLAQDALLWGLLGGAVLVGLRVLLIIAASLVLIRVLQGAIRRLRTRFASRLAAASE
ncbi:hypothetical protein [Azohydromonas australica]|uniref:hypothetical protein n=1 Tax=Azohydromonas australica TaxID=364039 RepID=UPI00041BE983|nr:hypothetical protein [Azohydromonas australica]